MDVDVDKIVERVEVLFDQALDLEEGGEEFPFILDHLDSPGPILIAIGPLHQIRPFLLSVIDLGF